MEVESTPSVWTLAIAGLAALVGGIQVRRGSGWLASLARFTGTAAPSDTDRRRSGRVLIMVGTGWLVTWWSQVWPFANQLKPYPVVILVTVLLPVATLLFVGWLGWFAVARRFTS